MKTLMLLALISTSAFAAESKSLAFNQIIIKKNTVNDIGILYVVNRSVASWCTGFGSPMSFGNYEAAVAIDSLEAGLHECNGKFVQVPGERANPIQIFEITNCTAVDAVELKATCPVPTPK